LSAIALSTERRPGGPMRLRIAVVRAVVDEMERSLNEFDQARLSSVEQQLVEELDHLARVFRRTAVSDVPMTAGGDPAAPASSPTLGIVLSLEAVRVRGGREGCVLAFSGYRLDLTAERLWKDQQELRLRRKPYSILRHLAQNPHRLVSQSEIVEAVWGRIVMSESLLRTHVHALRQVVGHGLIETIVGRGYRFTADVDRYVGRGLSSSTVEAPDDHAGGAEHVLSRDET
jgi:DNA-binding winged helix-turn-helix (wHTH) protein